MSFMKGKLFKLCNSLRLSYTMRASIYSDIKSDFSITSRSVHSMGLDDIPKVSILDIKKSLKQRGVSVYEGYTSILMKCPLCKPEKDCDNGRMFINKTTGYFLCPKCNHYGEWSILDRLLKKSHDDRVCSEDLQSMKDRNKAFAKEWKQLAADTVPLNALEENELIDLFSLFELPFHQDAAKTLCEVRTNETRNKLIFPLKNSADVVVNYKTVEAGYEELNCDFSTHMSGLFSCKAYKAVKDQDQAVLVPSIKDMLALASHKVPGMLVWWYSGTLPPSVLPVLESRSRVCVWVAGAPNAWANARATAQKIGNDRCHFVRPSNGATTAWEASDAGQSLKALIGAARPVAHQAITTFATLREDVLNDLRNIDKVRGVKWRRFPPLVRLLQGHRRGELTVLTGPTGSGKTTFCAEYSLDLAQQGVTTLWGSFEIKNSRLAKTMLQQFAGLPLEQNLDRFPEWADKFQALPIYYLTFHGAQSIKVVMEAVEHATYVHDIAHVVVDNVQFMLGAGVDDSRPADRFQRQDTLVAAFRTFATQRDCHVTLVMHPRKERDVEDLSTSSIFGSAKASQEADNVLIIQDKRLTAVRGKKFLQVAKNRYSGDLGIIPLEFDKESLSFAPKKKTVKPKTEKTGHENEQEPSMTDVLYGTVRSDRD